MGFFSNKVAISEKSENKNTVSSSFDKERVS